MLAYARVFTLLSFLGLFLLCPTRADGAAVHDDGDAAAVPHSHLGSPSYSSSSSSHPPVSLTWYAPILSYSGYGREAIDYLVSLDNASLWPTTQYVRPPSLRPSHAERTSAAEKGEHSSNAPRSLLFVTAEQHGDDAKPYVLSQMDSLTRHAMEEMIGRSRRYHWMKALWNDEEEDDDHDDDDFGGETEQNTKPVAGSQPLVRVTVCHSEPGAWSVPRPFYPTARCPPQFADIAIGRTMFETDRIPDGWVPRLNNMTEVWVPTAFHKETFERSGVLAEKLVIVPESIDTELWSRRHAEYHRPVLRRHEKEEKNETERLGDGNRQSETLSEYFRRVYLPLETPQGPTVNSTTAQRTKRSHCDFVFLSVFKWELRKGWDVLIRAFFEEFVKKRHPTSASVCLLLKTSGYHSTIQNGNDGEYLERVVQYLAEHYGVPFAQVQAKLKDAGYPIRIVSSTIPSALYPLLYLHVDALVQPSRGEGWGRPHVEAMAMEVPLLATNWSGPTAYLNERNGWPIAIESELSEVADGAFAGHRWAEPKLSHLKLAMRQVVEFKQTNDSRLLEKVQRAREDMVHQYDSRVVAAAITERLMQLTEPLIMAMRHDEVEREISNESFLNDAAWDTLFQERGARGLKEKLLMRRADLVEEVRAHRMGLWAAQMEWKELNNLPLWRQRWGESMTAEEDDDGDL